MKDAVILLLCAVALAQGLNQSPDQRRPCNCNPSEAQQICQANYDSDNVLIAHENCDQFYKCANGKPVAYFCPNNLMYDPFSETCEWPDSVDCGNRPISDGPNKEEDDGSDDVSDVDNDWTCNCNPDEAPSICAAEGSNGILVAHQNCNQFYKCAEGSPVTFDCSPTLLYNPYKEECDWAHNVECGDRVIPDPKEDDSNDDDDDDTENDGICNCNPEEAPAICAALGSENELIAHENCNKYYICNHGLPVAVSCFGDLLFNPYTRECDWPRNVDCGDRLVPETECTGCNDNASNDASCDDDDSVSTPSVTNPGVTKPAPNTPGVTNPGVTNPAATNPGVTNPAATNPGVTNPAATNPGVTNPGVTNPADTSPGNNCDPSEAPAICAADDSEGILVAHENCNQFYKCSEGKPVALLCPPNLQFNPAKDQCDWPENVDCGDRGIPDPESSDSGSSEIRPPGDDVVVPTRPPGTCNCSPGEAPSICAAEDSDRVLVAHENCNQFYKCDHGKPIVLSCYGDLLYNPYTEQCDWPENVDCGDRVIPKPDDSVSTPGVTNPGVTHPGVTNPGVTNPADTTPGNNCDPSEAPAICAADDSEGVLVAHENCNQFYECSGGKPVALLCPPNLLFNPTKDQCDWPENVDCGDRVIPDPESSDSGSSEIRPPGDDAVVPTRPPGTCNCNPGEAPSICAAEGSDGDLVAHENCNQFYKCDHGKPIVLSCYGDLLYNPYTEQCDWPENVDCGDRVIPKPDDSVSTPGVTNPGVTHPGVTNPGVTNPADTTPGNNCDPSEAPAICAADDSEGVLVAHENCNQFYECSGGKPVALLCPPNLLFNPTKDQCDWPENVDCGDRVIPDPESSDSGSSEIRPPGDDAVVPTRPPGTCNCNPGEAPSICAAEGSDGDLVAHENCNQFYKCDHGKPVVLSCYGDLLYNPYTEQCDWPANVDCGDRVIPKPDDSVSIPDVTNPGVTSPGVTNPGVTNPGVTNPGVTNPGVTDPGVTNPGVTNPADTTPGNNCDPSEAPTICAADNSEGVLVAHENCNQFYECSGGKPVALICPPNLLFNPAKDQCDWPENVDCGDRVIPDPESSDSGSSEIRPPGDDAVVPTRPPGTCNCNPGEAPSICAAEGSDGDLVAHENCNQFYKCDHGKPIVLSCYGDLLYNPNTEQCDWPENVDCGDRVIPKPDDSVSIPDVTNPGVTSPGVTNPGVTNPGVTNPGVTNPGVTAPGVTNPGVTNPGVTDPGVTNPGVTNPADTTPGNNCDPSEAPTICAADNSEGVLVAHENCNQFYECSGGKPVALICPPNLLFNPAKDQCDWPENVDCGDRVIPDPESSDSGSSEIRPPGDDAVVPTRPPGTCNCNPGEAPSICAAEGSDGDLVAHENCNQFYKCDHGKPIVLSCYGDLLYNPNTEQCDWPENVDCGDRVIPKPDDSVSIPDVTNPGVTSPGVTNPGVTNPGVTNPGVTNPGVTAPGVTNPGVTNPADTTPGNNCDPSEAPAICAADNSEGVLVAHENCNKFYECSGGKPVALICPPNLLFNPAKDQCDWPENVDCGDRGIPDPESSDSGSSEIRPPGDDVVVPTRPPGTCNCSPGEAPSICAAEDSDGVLVAHENCNQFYKCDHGKPIVLSCYGDLLYNPYTEQCDWPENVDCGDRVIPKPDDSVSTPGVTNPGVTHPGVTNPGVTNPADTTPGNNCDPSEAPAICAADDSEGVLVAHENCNQFYECSGGKPVALLCPPNLLFNPTKDQCDWPENVDCGDRVIPDPESSDSGSSEIRPPGDDAVVPTRPPGTCNCNPGEAPSICAAEGSDGDLVAHENCNQFYKCDHGKPIVLSCYGDLLYNPYTEQCDWPENVDCGDRVIPKPDDSVSIPDVTNPGVTSPGVTNPGVTNPGVTNPGVTNPGVTDPGVTNPDVTNPADTTPGNNCDPSEAPTICAADNSEGVLVAHENCNQFYECSGGKPVALICPPNLLFNPAKDQCDWPENVDCGDRVIPDPESSDSGSSEIRPPGDDAVVPTRPPGTCNCSPGEAPSICAAEDSDGVLVAHENCNQFYKCDHGKPVVLSCYGDLLYNPYTEQCDWPENVDCGDRVIPKPDDSVSIPDVTNPGVTNPGVTNPGVTYPGVTNPGVTNPGVTNPGVTNPGVTNPGVTNPGATNPADTTPGNNCDPSEAPAICAADDSEGVLVAHEKCNQFYKCSGGKPVALLCPPNLLFNPAKDQCDWPENVDCGDRVIPDPESSDSGSSEIRPPGDDVVVPTRPPGTCNCSPGEAPSICAAEDSDGVLVAHENCNQFYKCDHGKPIVLSCYGHLLYNPYTEQCDWPENVDCGDRVIPKPDDSVSTPGVTNPGVTHPGVTNPGVTNPADTTPGNNCDPSEAPAICAADDSEGVLVAHENCNQFYECSGGKPVALTCPPNLLFNPNIEQCDWPFNVDCGDRVIPDPEDTDSDTSEIRPPGDDVPPKPPVVDSNEDCSEISDENGDPCNCDPDQAPSICAVNNSDGILIAHENCHQFYQCNNGRPIPLKCPVNTLFNPVTQVCDWAFNVECGDRIIPDPEENVSESNEDDSKEEEPIVGPCNCNPEEAPTICAVDGSSGVQIAHENCNQFYICDHGRPMAFTCTGFLLYNPYTKRCDWPEYVECGDRVIPEPGSESDENDSNEDNISNPNDDPSQAPTICAGDGSEGVLVAHENCDQYYICSGGLPVSRPCNDGLLYNPYNQRCDWPSNVVCGDRIVSDVCACNPRNAPALCAIPGSQGKLVAHENCNQFYICSNSVPVPQTCPASLLYNPDKEYCDWPQNVNCENRLLSWASLNKHWQSRQILRN